MSILFTKHVTEVWTTESHWGGFVKSINRESGPDLGPEGHDCCVLWRLRMARGTAQGVDLGRGELPLASGVSSVGPSSSSPFSISTMVMAGGER
jgi:hypothetical protein